MCARLFTLLVFFFALPLRRIDSGIPIDSKTGIALISNDFKKIKKKYRHVYVLRIEIRRFSDGIRELALLVNWVKFMREREKKSQTFSLKSVLYGLSLMGELKACPTRERSGCLRNG